MNNSNNSSFFSYRRNPNDHHDQCHKPKLFICEFCHKVFTTGQALGGHKTCHRSKKLVDDDDHVHKGYKSMKITFSLSSSPSYHNNGYNAEQKKHSWTRVFKATVHHPPTASVLKPIQQQETPAVDLLSLLPPRSYTTKKRSKRYLVQDELANNAAPIPLLDVSRESVANLDLNHPDCKRMKLSSNVRNDTEMMQKQHVLPTTLKASEQEISAVDLVSFLPPRSYNTKKRSRRYLIHDGLSNYNTAPIPLLDMSLEPVVNLDLNHHHECKRMKLSCNGNDTEMMQKPFVLPTSDGIDETVVKEEKNLKEGETVLGLKFVRGFDLNELPTNDVETELGPRVVRNFDLNEFPTNDFADEIKHSP